MVASTMPSQAAEPVSSYTSQDWAMRCAHMPTRENIWPNRKMRKSRCSMAWKIAQRMVFFQRI